MGIFNNALLWVGLLFVGACQSHGDPKLTTPAAPMPAWLQQRLAEYERMDEAARPVAVRSWVDQGQRFYYVVAGCCDRFNEVYDQNGQYACAPDGGFTGRGDGKCVGLTPRGPMQPVWPKTLQ